jgi:hypothetical protein
MVRTNFNPDFCNKIGPLQTEVRIGAHLQRLKADHGEAVAAQTRNDRALVAATRLDTHPLDPVPTQPGR